MARKAEKLTAWVRWYGVSRLARSLKVRRQAVQNWIGVKKQIPGRDNAKLIVALSKSEPGEIGPLGLEDVL